MTRQAAEKALVANPVFPAGSEYTMQELGGQWVAAIHVAGPFPPADDSEESPAPKSEGPDDSGPSDATPPGDDAGAPPSDDGASDGGGEGGPPKEHGEHEKGKGGEDHLLHQVMDALTQIGQALGVPLGMGDSMVPGPDGGDPMGDPMGGPPGGPGMGGPPVPPPHGHGGPPPPGHGGPDVSVHERALKPGEVPPGGTPVGAPAFASVSPDHPWAHTVGKVPHFRVAEELGEGQQIEDAEAELQSLASAGGFKVSRVQPLRGENGERVISAVIETPKR